jgi:hypothetical protein
VDIERDDFSEDTDFDDEDIDDKIAEEAEEVSMVYIHPFLSPFTIECTLSFISFLPLLSNSICCISYFHKDLAMISTWRLWQYVGHVLSHRLGRGYLEHSTMSPHPDTSYWLSSEDDSHIQHTKHHQGHNGNGGGGVSEVPIHSLPFMPVPLCRNRLVETLGAVTMICFVDDDVICESYRFVLLSLLFSSPLLLLCVLHD